ncbi:MAG: VWA domain-containing protein [Acidobacteria bacterium]|nr:VWA domain-containing protein [Acidobacteriota bacterium]
MGHNLISKMKKCFRFAVIIVFTIWARAEINYGTAQQQSSIKAWSPLPGVRLDSNLVTVPVTVSTYGRGFVKGLRSNHFEVYDEKVQQQIAFFSNDEQPASVGIMLDFSGSMAEEKIVEARRAIREFIEWSNPEDEFFLIGFNDRVHLLRDFTSSADDIASSVVFTEASGKTAVFDAVYMGIEKVKQGRHQRRALVLFSDGQDNASRYSQRALKQLVQESDVLIYCIGIFGAWESPMNLSYGWYLLDQMSKLTGGRAFAITADQPGLIVSQGPTLTTICQQVATELRCQYTLGFYPTDREEKEKWRRLKVRLKPIKGLGPLMVHFRQGYSR